MKLQKFRWSKVYESSEEELLAFLEARNLQAICEMAGPLGEARPHLLDSESTIWCAEGSLSLQVDVSTTSLQPGDAIRIPANTTHTTQPGISGYTCYRTKP